MKSISYVVLLLLLSLMMGCNESANKHCLLPDNSEWVLAQGDVSFKVKSDSLFWIISSDVNGVPAVSAFTEYQLFPSGKIDLQNHLPLLSQDLPYVCGKKVADVYQLLMTVHQCKSDNNKIVFYSSDDSIIFYSKK